MFIQMPIHVQFHKYWKQLQIEKIIKLGELCGLVFTNDFNEEGKPEFIGNEKCLKEFNTQLNSFLN